MWLFENKPVKLVALFLLFFDISCGSAQTKIPYHLGYGGHFLIKVKVNNVRDYLFVVDTGAQNTSVYKNVVEELNIQPVNKQFTYVQGATGMLKSPLYKIDDINIAGQTFTNFLSATTESFEDENKVGGIVGMDFLANYVVEFNCDTSHIILHDSIKTINPEQIFATIPFHSPIADFIFFDIKAQDETLTAIMDTGARRNVMPWTTAKTLGINKNDTRLIEDLHISGASGKKTQPLQKIILNQLVIGNKVWHKQSITIADIAIYAVMPKQKHPAIIIGSPIFSKAHFVIDYQHKQLLLFSVWP